MSARRTALVAGVLERHARRPSPDHLAERCLCGWHSRDMRYETHAAEQVLDALTTDLVTRPRTDDPLTTCEHDAPYNGRGCIECRIGRPVGRDT